VLFDGIEVTAHTSSIDVPAWQEHRHPGRAKLKSAVVGEERQDVPPGEDKQIIKPVAFALPPQECAGFAILEAIIGCKRFSYRKEALCL